MIGNALMTRLRAEGVDCVGVHRELFDLSNGASLVKFVGRRPMAIIHLAAAVPHSTYYPDDESSAAKTRAIDEAVYLAAVEWGCRLVYASACSLYDKYIPAVKFENSAIVLRPESPYITAKYDGEQLFSTLPFYSIIRVPAPIGPDLPDTVVAKRFLKQAMAGEIIRIWGSGMREQNYVDVTDIADIFFRSAFSKSVGIFNSAAHAPTTMLELAAIITRVVNIGSFELAGVDDPLDGEYARYSNTLAREVLGCMPRLTLEDSIRSML